MNEIVTNLISAVVDSEGRIVSLVASTDAHDPVEGTRVMVLGEECTIIRTPEGDFMGDPSEDPLAIVQVQEEMSVDGE